MTDSENGSAPRLMTQVFSLNGRDEWVMCPETKEAFELAAQLGRVQLGRVMMLTREQIREWDLQIDIRELPPATAVDLVFADDDEFYSHLVFDDYDALGLERRLDPVTEE